MKMPVHIFISMCNILASQFKQEAEKQKEEQEEATTSIDVPNLRQLTDIGSITSGMSLPSVPGI